MSRTLKLSAISIAALATLAGGAIGQKPGAPTQAQYQKAEWEYDPDANRIYAFDLQNAPRFWLANSFLRKAASRTGILIIVCSSIALGCGLIFVFRKSLRRV